MFMQRIKELRNELGLTQDEFGALINKSRSSIANYETTPRYPDVDTLIEISSKFDVSVDWLLGLSDSKKRLADSDTNYINKIDSIKKLLVKENILSWGESLSPEFFDIMVTYGIKPGITIIKLLKESGLSLEVSDE